MRVPRPPRGLGSHEGDPMTPMIDVVFLLLVFFIAATVGGIADRLLPADLSGNSTAAAVLSEPNDESWQHPAIGIRIQPGANGPVVLLDNQPLPDPGELSVRLKRLAAVDPDSRIILDVHDDLPAQQFITLYDLCQGLKFRNISIAVHSK